MSNLSVPIALLVVYDSGFKFKYKKYYLSKGANLIGSHSSCQVIVADGERVAQRAANLYITDQLATIQPFGPNCLHVLSNVKKRNNLMVEIAPMTKYVIEMEKDFLICGRKALVQISSLEELLQIKGVINENMFDLSEKNSAQSLTNSYNNIMKNQSQNINKFVPSSQFQATVPLDDFNFQSTVPFGNTQLIFQATQLIDDQTYQDYGATLPLDTDMDLIAINYGQSQQASIIRNISQQKQQSSQQRPSLLSSIPSHHPMPDPQPPSLLSYVPSSSIKSSLPKQPNPIQNAQRGISDQSISVSMPQTIREQQQMPATIKDDEQPQIKIPQIRNIINNNNLTSSLFPPTIQESQPNNEYNIDEIKKKYTNLTKSQPVYRQLQKQKFEKIDKNISKFQQNKNPVPHIDSFDDLFGGIEENPPSMMTNSNKTVSLKSYHGQSIQFKKINSSRPLIKQTHSQHASQKTQKLQSQQEDSKLNRRSNITNKFKQNETLNRIQQVNQDYSQGILKKCFVIGKINKIDQQKLKKKNYEIVSKDQSEKLDFELLLIQGELKINKILLLALIKGKQIKPISWISNPLNKLSGKLEGFLWQHIQKRKGKGNQIFTGKKNFFLQEQLQQEYSEVMNQAGATLVKQLTKTKSKLNILVIIDQKSQQGKELWESKKNYKNWSFYSKRMIIESILMGQEIIDKYKLDAYSF